jgi:hypothetical protein
MKSIMQKSKKCYICGTTYGLEEHHCIHGTSNRKNAEKTGLKVWLCWEHHRMVHSDPWLDLQVKKEAQQKFEETHTREEFRQIFRKSWL